MMNMLTTGFDINDVYSHFSKRGKVGSCCNVSFAHGQTHTFQGLSGPADPAVKPIWSKFGQSNGETECGCFGTAFAMFIHGGADPHTHASKTCMHEFHADLASCHLRLAGRSCLTRLWGCEQAWAGYARRGANDEGRWPTTNPTTHRPQRWGRRRIFLHRPLRLSPKSANEELQSKHHRNCIPHLSACRDNQFIGWDGS